METLSLQVLIPHFLCSYPTYEEWKHLYNIFFYKIIWHCSYPTYEEWKRKNRRNNVERKRCSYPTYEEWKLSNYEEPRNTVVSSYPTYEEWKRKECRSHMMYLSVLILPMRNGNSSFVFFVNSV